MTHDAEFRVYTVRIPAGGGCELAGLITSYLPPPTRIILEKLTVTQLVKKFLAVYEIRRFITVFTKTGHYSLS
jgi:hypothetical protein